MPKAIKLDQRKERLAINFLDLERIQPIMRQIMGLFHYSDGGRLNAKQSIWIDKKVVDEVGVEFVGDLIANACLCDTIRTHDRNSGDYPTRVYIFKESAWSKVASNATLVKVVGPDCVLNPDIFPKVQIPIKCTALKVERIDFDVD